MSDLPPVVSWYPSVPPLGYWETYLVLCLGHIALRLVRPMRFSEFKK